ncbi:MAG: phage tail sheath subtilisin-like domain-containing protein [Devosia sp.]
MVDSRFHGITTREYTEVPRAVELIDISQIGLVGTAPDADAENWPLDKPILITGERSLPAGLGLNGTIPDALDDIWDQANATIVAVRIAEEQLAGDAGVDVFATMANMLGDRLQMTGVHALRKAEAELGIRPGLLCAPGYTSQRPTDGVGSVTIDAGGTGYIAPPLVSATGTGTGFVARAVVSGGAVIEVIIDNPGVGFDLAPTIVFTPVDGGSGAAGTAVLATVANPIGKELESIAARMRAMVVVDGPNTTNEAAVLARQDYGTDRVKIVDPWVKVAKGGAIITRPPSARVCGLQVKVDVERGFWHSPSNKDMAGILGLSRPITWALSDPSTDAEYLNDNDVTTIIRNTNAGGFKLWGNRTTSGDSIRAFWNVRRTSDVIIESIELACQPFVDEPFSVELIANIGETASAGLRKLVARGATLGSRVWLDPALNTKETFVEGKLYISYDAEPVGPAEHIIFEYHRNTGYYEQLAADAARELERRGL